MKITPVVLSGGSGNRLWPLSRQSFPKQFSKIFGNISPFQETVKRVSSSTSIVFDKQVVVSNSNFRFIIEEQLLSVGLELGSILLEPSSKNTAAAILSASFFCSDANEDSILLVVPSDHFIPNNDAFIEVVSKGYREAKKGKLVAFGIKPTRAETGYGYLEVSEKAPKIPLEIIKFIEKPQRAIAEKMILSNNFLWNAGIFMFRARDMISAFKKYFPSLIEPVRESVTKKTRDLNFWRLDKRSWDQCANISIDYAIMEKTDSLVVIPYTEHWSDLGDWNSVWEENKTLKDGVVLSDNATAIDCKNVMLRSENSSQEIVGLGLKDIIAVSMPDAVLVIDKKRSQDVKLIVDKLRNRNVSQAELFPKDHRPWGWFESLSIGSNYQVKKIFVKGYAALSLQSHKHRSEHWVVVQGLAKVTLDQEIRVLREGESIYIPCGSIHRLENTDKDPIVLIEVQIGSYLGEDDITRYEDVYARD